MSAQGLTLVLASALVHAIWNLLAKSADDKRAFFWLALLASLLLYLPVLLWAAPRLPFQWAGWPYVVATGLLHAAYFLSLGRAYSLGELSLVYPLARGTSPLLVAVGAVLVLGERPSGQGALGILLVVGGAFLLHAPGFSLARWLEALRQAGGPASRWALLTGLTTAAYSLVDKVGVSLVHPFLYIYFMFLLSALAMAPLALGGWREALRREWRERAPRVAAVGLMWLGGYGLALAAMRTDPVSYVVAARHVSIVFGAALGVLVLKEGHALSRLCASALLAVGVGLIGLAR
ncbi:MAG: EamA family transporter [Nitrospinota bacterium]